jgi:hypothetical protein
MDLGIVAADVRTTITDSDGIGAATVRKRL